MQSFVEGYALVIAIANYPKVSKLPSSILKDGRDIENILRSPTHCGYPDRNIRLLLDSEANANGIREGLRWLADVTSKNGSCVIFFSGHGGRLETSPSYQHYIIPYDCDPNDLDGTALNSSEITGLLNDIRAQRLLVVFDCCYAAGTGDLKGLSPKLPAYKEGIDLDRFAQLAQGAGRVMMASSRHDEESLVLHGMKNSLFTHTLLEAMKGEARTRGDGLIRVFDVFDYISEAVPGKGPQHPVFKAYDLENNFPIALYLGGQKSGADRQRVRTTHVDKRQLVEVLTRLFTLEDMELLCLDVEQALADDGIEEMVNLELVDGKARQGKALHLAEYLQNRGYLAYLVQAVRRRRPWRL